MPRKFLNSADSFCYVCGKATFSTHKRSITPLIRKAYHCYFGCKIGDQVKSWVPHTCCNTCVCNLRNWLQWRSNRLCRLCKAQGPPAVRPSEGFSFQNVIKST